MAQPSSQTINHDVPGNPADDLAQQRTLMQRFAGRALQARRNSARTTEVLGADAPEAQDAAATLMNHVAFVGRVTVAVQQTSVPLPDVAPDAFVMYGRVSDGAGAAIAGVVVEATDDVHRCLGQDTTDGVGAFVIRMPAGSGGASGKEHEEQAPSATAQPKEQLVVDLEKAKAPPDAKARPDATAPPVRGAYLSIVQGGTTLFRDTAATPIVAGTAVPREIAIPKTTPPAQAVK